LRGIIFLLDAAAASEEAGLAERPSTSRPAAGAAEALHGRQDVQEPEEMPVLVAANKLDLFTALPPNSSGSRWRRRSRMCGGQRRRAEGLGRRIGEEDGVEDERDWLGRRRRRVRLWADERG